MIKKKKAVRPKKAKKPTQLTKKPIVKKEKTEGYILKKNSFMKVLRVIFWGMLVFFFLKGVLTVLRPDPSAEVHAYVQNFKEEFKDYKDSNEELLGFAQNFAKEYLTYEEKGEADYKVRLEPYVSEKIKNMTDIATLSGEAKAIYVQAYRKEQYSGAQFDVYVKAEVQYVREVEEEKEEEEAITNIDPPISVVAQSISEESSEAETSSSEEIDTGKEGTEEIATDAIQNEKETKKSVSKSGNGGKSYVTKIETRETTLKIPVYMSDNGYVVEDLPIFVSDFMKDENYKVEDYYGTSVDDNVAKEVQESLVNFLTAYYTQDQSVIEYYLTKDADRTKFLGLSNRYLFEKINNMKCYQKEGEVRIICILNYSITDSVNEGRYLQDVNFIVIPEGDKYYIQEMNSRVGNLNI